MALEAVVFSQERLACTAATTMRAPPPSLGCGVGGIDELEEKGGVVLQEEVGGPVNGGGGGACWVVDAAACACSSVASGAVDEERWGDEKKKRYSVSPPPAAPGRGKAAAAAAAAARRRRRRPKAVKNKEEMESQRRNHIAVERNRRRQMNEYLAVLRSVMPPSYSQRGDQASIVAGAINFVKELEQLLQSLEAQKRCVQSPRPAAPPFAGFFTFPQYSVAAGGGAGSGGSETNVVDGASVARRGVADVEVAMAESHASVKVLVPQRPAQLLRMVVALQCLGLTVLHLNVTTTADHLALYSFSLKMEAECRLSSVDDIATAVHQVVAQISGDHVS